MTVGVAQRRGEIIGIGIIAVEYMAARTCKVWAQVVFVRGRQSDSLGGGSSWWSVWP